MNYEKVKKAIDEWDPIDLLSHAPKDEYDQISKKISYLKSEKDSLEVAGSIIFTVFLEAFGENTFEKSHTECTLIASKILR